MKKWQLNFTLIVNFFTASTVSDPLTEVTIDDFDF